ncbi:MAG: class I SAM-dependent methyltransferase [Bacteroidetes bacterium]|jgi:SAM-dependent methyltransferase|nr:class I SAM-dependent methyltransferase [Bacteroidota bacterium]MBK9355583.1 class I SAM-dependent methyltransferase [Bacteroidota bacterium]
MKIDNPAFNYDQFGHQYSGQRMTDPRIAFFVNEALADAKTILNVGAGAGSYEPTDKYVIAVEPSEVMRSQRMAKQKVPAIIAKADHLPFDDNAFDASMAMVTIHHWPNIEKGLKELRRVTRNQVVIMTFDPDALDNFWNAHYFPELIEVEKARYPSIDFIQKSLSTKCDIIPIPIPLDCVDGFQEAFYGRPEAFLEKNIRQAQSAWGFLSDEIAEKLVNHLAEDLKSGEWDKKYGHFRTQGTFTCALRLIVSR